MIINLQEELDKINLVNFTGGSEDIVGKLVNVKITSPKTFSLQGELVK